MKALISFVTALLLLGGGSAFSAEDYIHYTVQPKDDLTKIAQEQLKDTRAISLLMKVNGLKDPTEIKPGDIIFIPNPVEMAKAQQAVDETLKLLRAANEAGATTFAVADYDSAFEIYIDAGKQRDAGNPQLAVYKCKLASVYAERARKLALEKALQSLSVVLLKKQGTVENSIDAGKTWKTLPTLGESPSGSFIRTGKDSHAHLEFPDKSVYEIMPGTEIEISEVAKDSANAGALRTSIFLHDGEYIGKVRKAMVNDNISLNASGLAILIRGTTVRVTRDRGGEDSSLGVIEGKTTVKAGNGGGEMAIDGGRGILTKDTGEFALFDLPDAPGIDARFAGLVTVDPQPKLEWKRPAAATRVRFELAADPDFVQVIEHREVPADTVRPARPLAPGLYHWRVTSILAQGPLGAPGSTQKLTIQRNLAFKLQNSQPIQVIGGVPFTGPNNTVTAVPTGSTHILGFEHSWDGVNFQTMVEKLPVPNRSGAQTLHVRAFAANGKRSEAQTMTFTVEADAPVLRFEKARVGGKLALTFNAEDTSGIETLEVYDPDGNRRLANGGTLSVKPAPGAHVMVRAVDIWGNTSRWQRFEY